MLWLVALLLFVFLPVEFGLFLSGEENGLSLRRLFTLLPLAALSLLLAIVPILLLCGDNLWRLIITTRRILHRPSIWTSSIEEIRFDEIEEIVSLTDCNGLIVRGVGKELKISASGKKRTRIVAALGRT